jgi:hypothetical protein
MKKQFKLQLLLLLFPVLIYGNAIDPGKYIKQKEIKKAYFVNPDAGIDIRNSYGNVFVTTWNEDKIELEILIKVSGDDEDWVIKRLDGITVDIDALKSLVSAKTVIANSSNRRSNKANSIEINYTIKIPKNGAVKINNSYGAILTTDLAAATNLTCEYGKITLGKLNGNSNIISIDYCSKSTIDYVKNASIHADYSGLTINEFNKINLNADYTDLSFLKGNELTYNCNYGKLTFDTLKNINGTGDYLSITINKIATDLNIETQYSKLTVGEIDAAANAIAINTKYTAVSLGYDPEFAFNFNVSVKYASFKYEGDFEFTSKQESSFSKSYQGYYKKSGQNKIVILSEYANVNLHKK